MFGSLISTMSGKAGSFESKLMLYIIGGVLALVIINLLLDGVRKFIRGLDTAALGALLIWLGYKASTLQLVSVLTNLLYLIGGTLFISGVLIFIIMTAIKRKRAVTRSGPPMPKHAQTSDKAKAAEAGDKSAADTDAETKKAPDAEAK
ncbi:MAG: hypothetical protein IJJ06_07245 [Mogibacterium sp.]|nr:hypothetical protein [Mogibacterium sp.]